LQRTNLENGWYSGAPMQFTFGDGLSKGLLLVDVIGGKSRRIKQNDLLCKLLNEGRSVVVDNTNPTIEDRAVLLKIGRVCDAKSVCYHFIKCKDLRGTQFQQAWQVKGSKCSDFQHKKSYADPK